MAAKSTTPAPEAPRKTKLDSDVSMPGNVAPGDAPYDTTDPNERATSVTPDKATAAKAGYGVVNAVVPLPEPERVEAGREGGDRTEEYDVVGPNGKVVRVKHNIDTGETSI